MWNMLFWFHDGTVKVSTEEREGFVIVSDFFWCLVRKMKIKVAIAAFLRSLCKLQEQNCWKLLIMRFFTSLTSPAQSNKNLSVRRRNGLIGSVSTKYIFYILNSLWMFSSNLLFFRETVVSFSFTSKMFIVLLLSDY